MSLSGGRGARGRGSEGGRRGRRFGERTRKASQRPPVARRPSPPHPIYMQAQARAPELLRRRLLEEVLARAADAQDRARPKLLEDLLERRQVGRVVGHAVPLVARREERRRHARARLVGARRRLVPLPIGGRRGRRRRRARQVEQEHVVVGELAGPHLAVKGLLGAGAGGGGGAVGAGLRLRVGLVVAGLVVVVVALRLRVVVVVAALVVGVVVIVVVAALGVVGVVVVVAAAALAAGAAAVHRGRRVHRGRAVGGGHRLLAVGDELGRDRAALGLGERRARAAAGLAVYRVGVDAVGRHAGALVCVRVYACFLWFVWFELVGLLRGARARRGKRQSSSSSSTRTAEAPEQ